MSKYTMELRNVIKIYSRSTVESWFKDYELSDYLTPDEIEVIESRGTWNKDKLASEIVDNYYMREIGLETPALFKHYAKIKMKKIMEEKLPLIYSTAIKYDPLVNVNFTESFIRNIDNENENSGTSSSTNNSSSIASGLTVNSDTPQGQISKSSILEGKYASSTSAGDSESSSTTTDKTTLNNNGTAKTKEDYTKTIKGNSGVSATAQAMILQYRKNIVTINKDIIEELSDLFFGLY